LSLGVAARLITRFGAKNTLIPGLAVIPIGLAYFARAPIDADYLVDLFPAFLLIGIGAGLSFPALMTLAMAGATQEESGLASGLVNTTQQVGGALGLAVLATIATSRTDTLTAAGSSDAAALLGGFHVAWAIAAGVGAVAFILAVTLLKPDHVAAAEVAQREEEIRVSRGLGSTPREAEQPEFAFATED
jgi:MFS family permease